MADKTSDLVKEVLQALQETSPLLSHEAFPNVSYNELKAALQRLQSRDMVQVEQLEREEVLLEEEGQQIVANGSHEARVFEALRKAVEGLTIEELQKVIGDKDVTKVGHSRAFKEKWIAKDGKKFKAAKESVKDTTKEQLQAIKDTRSCSDSKTLAELKKRKLVKTQKVINFKIAKGNSFALVVKEEPVEFTVDDFRAWRKTRKAGTGQDVSNLRPYNFKAE